VEWLYRYLPNVTGAAECHCSLDRGYSNGPRLQAARDWLSVCLSNSNSLHPPGTILFFPITEHVKRFHWFQKLQNFNSWKILFKSTSRESTLFFKMRGWVCFIGIDKKDVKSYCFVCFAGWNVTLFEGDPSPPVLHCHRRMLFRHEATFRYVGFFHNSNFCYCYYNDLYLILIRWFWFFLCPPFYGRSWKRQRCWAGCTNRYMERTGGITGEPALSCFCLSFQQMISYIV